MRAWGISDFSLEQPRAPTHTGGWDPTAPLDVWPSPQWLTLQAGS